MDDKWALALAVKLQEQQERKQLCRHKSSAPQKEKSKHEKTKRPKCAALILYRQDRLCTCS